MGLADVPSGLLAFIEVLFSCSEFGHSHKLWILIIIIKIIPFSSLALVSEQISCTCSSCLFSSDENPTISHEMQKIVTLDYNDTSSSLKV